MSGLDYLFNGTPDSITQNTASTSTMPDWYQEYIRGIAGKGTEIAGQGYQPYEGQRLADFNDTQRQAFDQVSANQGAWKPAVNSALDAAGQIQGQANAGLNTAAGYGTAGVGAATGAGTQANAAVAGAAPSWTDNYQKYMSPYTSSVVNEIARLGNQNLTENVIPGLTDQFVGSGQFGSSRNADMVGRAVRDSQANISGLQSQALQSGYTGAADIFNSDAARAQAQQGMQANTALSAGQLASGANTSAGQLANSGAQIGSAAADTAAGRFGALGTQQQTAGANDAAALGAVGGQQQALEQQGYDMAKGEFDAQKNYEWQNLGNLNSIVRGMQLPTGQTSTTNAATTPGSPSPLGWVNSMYGVSQANAATGK